MIPQTEPRASYLAHKEAIDRAVREVLEGGWYILGGRLKAFEEAFARFSGCAYGIGVANGTDAIELALRAVGVGANHIVFTVSHTAVATVVGIERAGAIPLPVDIDPATYTMDPGSLKRAIESIRKSPIHGAEPKAIVVVHLYGHPADMDAITDIATHFGLIVIEDCAQAHGASWRGRAVGSIGQAAAFSFYPTKNLGAIGDGGIITTNDSQVAQRCRMLREYGWQERYVSEITGVNSRLDELQAAILHAKLEFLDADNGRRQAIARTYEQRLAGGPLVLPTVALPCTHVYHQFVVRSAGRDALRQHLKDRGVGTLVHYPQPVHVQPAYRGRLPLVVPLEQTELATRQVLSLPIFPELAEERVLATCDAIHQWQASFRGHPA